MVRDERILILCIDRDDDLSRKTGMKGPVIGERAVLKAANRLGLADPEDSDFNAVFQALKVFNELANKKEIALLTGHRSGGIKADQMIATQLDSLLKRWPASQAILITDGADDERVLPIIQSRLPIMSVSRVVVKQSDRLESAYFKIKDFLKDTLEDPKMARLVLGLPAIILLLLAIFGIEGGRVILGVIGVYLLIKGFKLEFYVGRVWDEFRTAVMIRKGALFSYILGGSILVVGTYHASQTVSTLTLSWIELMAVFIQNSIFVYWLAWTVAWIGRTISLKKSKRKLLSTVLMSLAISFVLYAAAEFILTSTFTELFLYTLISGFVSAGLALVLEFK